MLTLQRTNFRPFVLCVCVGNCTWAGAALDSSVQVRDEHFSDSATATQLPNKPTFPSLAFPPATSPQSNYYLWDSVPAGTSKLYDFYPNDTFMYPSGAANQTGIWVGVDALQWGQAALYTMSAAFNGAPPAAPTHSATVAASVNPNGGNPVATSNLPVIIGGAAGGGIVLCALIGIAAFCLVRRRKQKQQPTKLSHPMATGPKRGGGPSRMESMEATGDAGAAAGGGAALLAARASAAGGSAPGGGSKGVILSPLAGGMKQAGQPQQQASLYAVVPPSTGGGGGGYSFPPAGVAGPQSPQISTNPLAGVIRNSIATMPPPPPPPSAPLSRKDSWR